MTHETSQEISQSVRQHVRKSEKTGPYMVATTIPIFARILCTTEQEDRLTRQRSAAIKI